MNPFGVIAHALGGISLALLLAGCTTLTAEPGRQHTREREDFLILSDEIRRLEGRIEGIEMENARLQSQWDESRRRQDASAQAQASGIREQLAGWDRRMQALETARASDREEIVSSLSRQISELMQQRRAPARASGRRAGGAETGYEHVVGPGETLSTIAAAYGTRLQVIQEANQIQNPNVLRIGQVLFIPEP